MQLKSYVWHPNTQMGEWDIFDVITSAKGMWLTDSNGNKMLDAVASMWCNVWGHSQHDLIQTLRTQAKRLQHSPLFNLTNEPAEDLAASLIRLNPDMYRVFFSDNGSTAMEISFKMALQYWKNEKEHGKTKIASFENGYHGDTFGAMSVGHVPRFFDMFQKQLFPTVQFQVPSKHSMPRRLTLTDYQQQCLDKIEKRFSQDSSIAALVMESGAQVAGGVVIYPNKFQRSVCKLCRKHGVLFVLDEIATGLGRLGSMTEYSSQDSKPDIVSFGKMLTGGYLSMAATLATKRIYDSFLGDFDEQKHLFHGHTYTGNPLAASVANKNLKMYKENGLIKKIQKTSKIFESHQPEIESLEMVGDVRHKGMLMGIELAKYKDNTSMATTRSLNHVFYKLGRRNGIYLRMLGNILMIVPPLAISEKELDMMVSRATMTIKDAQKIVI